MWGCPPHWHTLPADLRAGLWVAYRPGQETDKRPSAAWVAAARAADEWAQDHEARRAAARPPTPF